MRRCRNCDVRFLAITPDSHGGFDEHVRIGQQIHSRQTRQRRVLARGVIAMSSPEELTLVVGRWLRPIVAVLSVVHRLKPTTTSSREQVSTTSNH